MGNKIRFKDPETGKIPEDMRRKEMIFVQNTSSFK